MLPWRKGRMEFTHAPDKIAVSEVSIKNAESRQGNP